MKKKLFAFFLILFVIIPVFAANEYCQIAINYGSSDALTAPYIGLHSQYQFGASFSTDFDLGFGTYADLDFALSNVPGNDIGFSLCFGPAFALKQNDFITTTVLFGPEIRTFEDSSNTSTDEAEYVGLGIGASLGYTFIPKEERDARVSMGFTIGAMGSVFWLDDDHMKSSVKGFFGITLKGPLMFLPENDLYEEILWYCLSMN